MTFRCIECLMAPMTTKEGITTDRGEPVMTKLIHPAEVIYEGTGLCREHAEEWWNR